MTSTRPTPPAGRSRRARPRTSPTASGCCRRRSARPCRPSTRWPAASTTSATATTRPTSRWPSSTRSAPTWRRCDPTPGPCRPTRSSPPSPTPSTRYPIPLEAFDELIDGCELDVARHDLRHHRRPRRLLPAGRRHGRAPVARRLRRHGHGPRPPRWPTTSASPCSSPTSCATSRRTAAWAASTSRPRTCQALRLRARRRRARARRWPPRPVRGARAAVLVRPRPRAAAAARPAQPGLHGGHGRHLPPAARPHRGRPHRRARPSACRCPPGRRRGSRCGPITLGRGVTAPNVVVVGGGPGRAGRRAASWPTPARRSRSSSGGPASAAPRGRSSATACWFDNGQHVFLRCCTAYLAFLERIGADEPRAPPGPPRRAGPGARRPHGPAPPRPPARRRSTWAPASPATATSRLADRLRLGRAALGAAPARPRRPRARQRAPSATFLGQHGQQPGRHRAALGPDLPAHGQPAGRRRVARAGRQGVPDRPADRGRPPADIGWSRVPLGRAPRRARPAPRWSGPAPRCAPAPPSRPSRSARRPRAARGRRTSRGRRRRRRRSPSPTTRPPALPRRARSTGRSEWPELGTSPIVNVHLRVRPAGDGRRPRRRRRLAGAVRVRPHASRRARARASASPCRCRRPTSGSATPPDALIAMAERELAPPVPRRRRGRARRRASSPGSARPPSGAAPARQASGPGPATDRPGLYLAGAWTDTGWPATMEGAVRSGRRRRAGRAR